MTQKWVMTIMSALSMFALSRVAAAQVPFENLPKVMDASMPRDQQISIALSAGPEEVRDKASVYVLGPKGFEKAREGTNRRELSRESALRSAYRNVDRAYVLRP